MSITACGTPDLTLRFLVSLDMCPYWLEIAVEHLHAASLARAEVLGAKQRNIEPDVGSALEHEFSAGMQALTSAAIAPSMLCTPLFAIA